MSIDAAESMLKQIDVAETERLRQAALAELDLSESGSEPEFDDLVQLAAEICGVPMCAMTLLEEHRQVLKARVGPLASETPRSQAFCNYTVLQEGIFTVPDARADSRFCSNPLVTGDPGIRFYAAVPLRTEARVALGSLCVIDTEPRTLTAMQERTLRVLADQISVRLQLRSRIRAVETLSAEVHGERELFRTFLDNLPMEAYLKNSDGQILFYNRKLCERFGVSQQQWLGKTSFDLWPVDKAEAIHAEEEFVLQTGRTHESYIEIVDQNGLESYWKTVKSPVRRSNGELLLANLSIDLTEELRRESALQQAQDALEEANRKLRSLALTDELTSLWNRRAFDARLETEILHARRKRSTLALLMIDIDDFKQLNDSFGHSHGDDVLRQVAAVLREAVRGEDVAARFGGEEFAIILADTDLAGANIICDRIVNRLHGTLWSKRAVTASIGFALYTPEKTADDLLNMADEAMYRAKRQGKNCAVVYRAEDESAAMAVQAGR